MTGARISTQCCIAGGGPAEMMLGLLLACVGVNVLVLEKHADFLRDFRGNTIHPARRRSEGLSRVIRWSRRQTR